jgi:hypothetical protein
MAQTKTPTKKSKAKRPASTGGSKAKATANGSKARSGGSKRKAPASGRSAGSSRRSTSSARPSGGSSRQSPVKGATNGVTEGIKSARDSVEDAGQKAATATGKAVSKAKVPLIAGGAALVGTAGGIALQAARSKDSKVLGMKVPKTKVKIKSSDLVDAADRVAAAGEQIGRLSTGIREIQGTSDSGKGNGHHRSPIEVLIQGLTRRH